MIQNQSTEPALKQAQPDFFIGKIPIYGRLILAPMDGLSDPSFRWITRCLGSAYSVSEFINTLDYAVQKKYQANRLRFRQGERPFGFQLLDNEPSRMAEMAADLEEKYHPDFFDINMGCSTQRVLSRGAGAALMRDPDLIAACFKQVNAAVSVPVSGKMRLGMNEMSLNYREVADKVVENGGVALAVHGRTAKMAYSGAARWAPIAELKAALPIPVIGNGDVIRPEDAAEMVRQTNCDGVMIGRAAKANPWIFNGRERAEISAVETWQLAEYQAAEMIRSYPEGSGIYAFRKYIKAYLQPYGVDPLRLRQLLTVKEEAAFWQLFKAVFSELGVAVEQPNPWFETEALAL